MAIGGQCDAQSTNQTRQNIPVPAWQPDRTYVPLMTGSDLRETSPGLCWWCCLAARTIRRQTHAHTKTHTHTQTHTLAVFGTKMSQCTRYIEKAIEFT